MSHGSTPRGASSEKEGGGMGSSSTPVDRGHRRGGKGGEGRESDCYSSDSIGGQHSRIKSEVNKARRGRGSWGEPWVVLGVGGGGPGPGAPVSAAGGGAGGGQGNYGAGNSPSSGSGWGTGVGQWGQVVGVMGAGRVNSTKACGINCWMSGKIGFRVGVLGLAVLRDWGKQRFGSGLGLRSSRVYTWTSASQC